MRKSLQFFISLVLSITAHIFLYYALESLLKRPSTEVIRPPGKHVFITKIVERGPRVDIVKMPTHTLQELKKLEISKKRGVLLTLLKDIARQEINYPKAKPKASGEPKVLLMAGNILSEGVALVGGKRDPEFSSFHQYLDSLPMHIKPYWKLPAYLMENDFRCRIQINISKQGQLLSYTLIESSGNEDYDQRAMQATVDAAPYPRPDESILPFLQQGQIILGFPD